MEEESENENTVHSRAKHRVEVFSSLVILMQTVICRVVVCWSTKRINQLSKPLK